MVADSSEGRRSISCVEEKPLKSSVSAPPPSTTVKEILLGLQHLLVHPDLVNGVQNTEARDMLTNSNIPQGAVIATRAPRIPVVRISGKINPSVKSERSIEIMAPACMRLRAQSEQMKNSERTFTKHLVSRRPSPKKRRRARALAHTHGESSYTY